MEKLADIHLELYEFGIHLTCDDTEHDEFIPVGNAQMLVDLLNEIHLETDPNTEYVLTEKGKKSAGNLHGYGTEKDI